VSAVDYRSLSDTTTEAALRTAHAAAALQPTSVSRVVTREAFPTAEDLGEGGHGDGPTSSTTDSKADGQAGHNGPLDSFEFSFDGGGDDVLTDQLDASLITHLEVGPAARAQSHTAGAEEPPPPPRPVAAAAPKQHGRRRPRNKNGTFQSVKPPPSERPEQRRPRIVSAGSSTGSLSPHGSAPSSPVAARTDQPSQAAAAEARQQQRPGKTLRYAASSVVAPAPGLVESEQSPQPKPSRAAPAPGSTGRRRARRASDSDEEYLPGSEGRQYASTTSKSARRRQKKPAAPRRPTLSSSSDNDSADPNNNGSAGMPASSRQSENTGRWTAEEHRLFLQGLERHGKGWKKIATLIKSRTVVQIRTHAQKYFQKLAKARQSGAVDGHAALGVSTAEAHDGPPGSGRGGNMSIGTDPTSLAAAAGGMTMTTRGRRRRSAHPQGAGGGTKRRSIGNVVRSAVREGRTAKRLRAATSSSSAAADGNGPGDADEELVLPAVGTMLGHYVSNPPPAAEANSAAPAPVSQQRQGGRERKVTTKGHGTLTQAALEDAMYRMLTPADGRPTSEPAPSAVTSSATSSAQGGAADPLAIKMPSAPVPSAPYGMPGTSNVSPTGVADVAATAAAALPSWIDASNPTAAWYDAGDGIDTLLDDAEALGWLDDTGDPDEDYPPAVAPEPARVTAASAGTSGADNLMGSVDSLSFLVEPTPVGSGATGRDGADDDLEPNPVSAGPSAGPAQSHVQIDLEPNPVSAGPAAVTVAGTVYAPPPGPALYSSATEAVEAASSAGAPDAAPSSSCAPSAPSAANLMAFPELGDMGMGDEQAFVSALLGGPSSNGLDGSGVN